MPAAEIINSVRNQPGRWLIMPIVIAIAPALVLVKGAIGGWSAVPLISWQRIGVDIVYQLVALGLAGVVLDITYFPAPEGFRAFLQRGNLRAPVVPVTMVGIRPGPHETWLHESRHPRLRPSPRDSVPHFRGADTSL